MSDSITYREILDDIEHSKHNSYSESCPKCKSEARIIKAHNTVTRDRRWEDLRGRDFKDHLISPNPLE